MEKSRKKAATLFELAVMVLILAGLGVLGWRFYPSIRSLNTIADVVEPETTPQKSSIPSLRPEFPKSAAGGPSIHEPPSMVAEPPPTSLHRR